MTGRGFTFVEMTLAIAITAMTGLAIFAFASVTTRTWAATEHVHQLEVTSLQAGALTTNLVERSRALGFVANSPPRVFLWLTDSYGGAADGQAQFAEMGLIEYDASLKSLMLYRADLSAAGAMGGGADGVISTTEMTHVTYAELFKSMDWLEPPRTILGPGREVEETREMTRVNAATFTPVTSAGLPAFEMNVTLSRGRETVEREYVFVLRAPTLRPDYANPNE
jgi:hypothetical protein